MSAKFFDLHDESNPDNGAELFDGSGVRALLSRNPSRQAFFAELISDHQTRLLIGLGLKIGCVQFSDLTATMTWRTCRPTAARLALSALSRSF